MKIIGSQFFVSGYSRWPDVLPAKVARRPSDATAVDVTRMDRPPPPWRTAAPPACLRRGGGRRWPPAQAAQSAHRKMTARPDRQRHLPVIRGRGHRPHRINLRAHIGKRCGDLGPAHARLAPKPARASVQHPHADRAARIRRGAGDPAPLPSGPSIGRGVDVGNDRQRPACAAPPSRALASSRSCRRVPAGAAPALPCAQTPRRYCRRRSASPSSAATTMCASLARRHSRSTTRRGGRTARLLPQRPICMDPACLEALGVSVNARISSTPRRSSALEVARRPSAATSPIRAVGVRGGRALPGRPENPTSDIT